MVAAGAPRSRFAQFDRWALVRVAFLFCGFIVIGRLWQLQIVEGSEYARSAEALHVRERTLSQDRGVIYATERDGRGGRRLVPLAINRDAFLLYAEPRRIADPQQAAEALAPLLEREVEELYAILNKPNDPFEPLVRRATPELVNSVEALAIEGIYADRQPGRFYPGNNISSHLLGFVSYQEDRMVGQYGAEGALDTLLAGSEGFERSERGRTGAWIATGRREVSPGEPAADVVLTIDWVVQRFACEALNDWVKEHGASGGSVVMMDPATGHIIVMCGSPDFNPNVYNEIGAVEEFNNPAIFAQYEPGSIMKPLTMAAAIDRGAVTPYTVFEDTGAITIGPHTIRNSDLKAYGRQTMTDVLTKSLNTGSIFAMRSIGRDELKRYFTRFGFGAPTGITLTGEASGDIRSLDERSEIYAATASFGQGITATPLQMVTAYGALANGGRLVEPTLIKEIRREGEEIESRDPNIIAQVVTEKTAALVSGMLVTVVTEGHGKRAGVAGYALAGKTGTAQIPRLDGQGYEEEATIGSFIGYGPLPSPSFVMLVRVDRPQGVRFAESSAAPLFGKIADFYLQYEEVIPEQSSL